MAEKSSAGSRGKRKALDNAGHDNQGSRPSEISDGNGNAGSGDSGASKQAGGWSEHHSRLEQALSDLDQVPTQLFVPFADAPEVLHVNGYGVSLLRAEGKEIIARFSDGTSKEI